MEDLKTRAELLESTRWANDFLWAEIEAIASHLEVKRVSKGRIICREGDIDPSLFIIATGSVAVAKQDQGEQEKLIAKLGPGQTIGEMALLDGQPRSATVKAAEDAVLLVFTRAALDRMIDDKPRLGVKVMWKLARFLTARLRQTSGLLAEHLQT